MPSPGDFKIHVSGALRAAFVTVAPRPDHRGDKKDCSHPSPLPQEEPCHQSTNAIARASLQRSSAACLFQQSTSQPTWTTLPLPPTQLCRNLLHGALHLLEQADQGFRRPPPTGQILRLPCQDIPTHVRKTVSRPTPLQASQAPQLSQNLSRPLPRCGLRKNHPGCHDQHLFQRKRPHLDSRDNSNKCDLEQQGTTAQDRTGQCQHTSYKPKSQHWKGQAVRIRSFASTFM
jgi:hypothetical protein